METHLVTNSFAAPDPTLAFWWSTSSDCQRSGITHNACKDDEGMSRRQLGNFSAMRQPEASLDLPSELA